MSAMLDDLIAQVLKLEIQLISARARLEASTDDEALHDLRINLRRLRSLLRPLRGLPVADVLIEAARELGRITTPLRDLEVLIAELARHHHERLAEPRRLRLRQGCREVLQALALERLFQVLDAWPQLLRLSAREGLLEQPRKRIRKRLLKDWARLEQALADPAHDRHALRLLIKRARYGADAYPGVVEVSERTRRLLKGAQDALGKWHDRLQWLATAEREPDLAPRTRAWSTALHAAELRADRVLEKLQARLG